MNFAGRWSYTARFDRRYVCADPRRLSFKMMDFVLKMLDFSSKMMDFVLKMLDFSLKMMDFVLKMLDFAGG